MRSEFLLIVVAAFLFSSCNKERPVTINPPPPTTMEPPVVQAFLKDISIRSLPSPYYHFEYNTSGKVSIASFASDFTRYSVKYNGDRITELQNETLGNADKLEYTYDNEGRVILITYADFTGAVFVKVHLAYDVQNLVRLDRERKLGADFIFDKRLSMSYYGDGNLKEIVNYFPATPINGQIETTLTDHFLDYDDKVNVDGFGLLHSEFFDHLILLPGVQLQKNNPGREIRTGDGMNYEVIYTYNYNNKNFPLTKTGDLTITTGPDTGLKVQTSHTFSYYE